LKGGNIKYLSEDANETCVILDINKIENCVYPKIFDSSRLIVVDLREAIELMAIAIIY